MTIQTFVIDEADNVATNVADEIPKGTQLDIKGKKITTVDEIPYGHKIALTKIPQGGDVTKYGLCIGSATEDIQPGSHVHLHNVESNRGRGDKYQE